MTKDIKKSIVVTQSLNPKFISGEDAKEEKNTATHVYCVVQAINILHPRVNEWLLPSQVQSLIDSGVNVTIKSS